MPELYLAYLKIGLDPNLFNCMNSWSVHTKFPKLLKMNGLEQIVYLERILNRKHYTIKQVRKMVNKNCLKLLSSLPKKTRKIFTFIP